MWWKWLHVVCHIYSVMYERQIWWSQNISLECLVPVMVNAEDATKAVTLCVVRIVRECDITMCAGFFFFLNNKYF